MADVRIEGEKAPGASATTPNDLRELREPGTEKRRLRGRRRNRLVPAESSQAPRAIFHRRRQAKAGDPRLQSPSAGDEVLAADEMLADGGVGELLAH